MANHKIIIATGGTGGHIFPALALKNTLDELGNKVVVTGDARFARFHDFDADHILIPAANLSGRSVAKLFISLMTLAHGFLKALLFIYQEKPDLVIGFGGYATYPIMLASIILRKKIMLHEANAFIGKVNKLLLGHAKYLTCGFKTTYGVVPKYLHKLIYTGNPVRQEILKLKPNRSEDKFTILVIGGSQGAKIFSTMIPDAILSLPMEIKVKLHIFQQAKTEDIEKIKTSYVSNNITCEVKSFFSDMNEKLSQANLMISRSGASTIAELIATNLPSILIPLPNSADNHQYYNAKEMADREAAWLLQENANVEKDLAKLLNAIAQNRDLLAIKAAKLKKLEQNASSNIAKIAMEVIEYSANWK